MRQVTLSGNEPFPYTHLLPQFPQTQVVWTLLPVFPALFNSNSILPGAQVGNPAVTLDLTANLACFSQRKLWAGAQPPFTTAGPPHSPAASTLYHHQTKSFLCPTLCFWDFTPYPQNSPLCHLTLSAVPQL